MKFHKMRKTPERFAILDRILRMPGHFSIEQLFHDMESGDYHVSRATIYNTVNLLTECGLLIRHKFGDGSCNYEAKADSSDHIHLVCRECGCIQEIFDHEIVEMLDNKKYSNFVPDYAELTIYGMCRRCSRKIKSPQRAHAHTEKQNK